jgi:signal transduction histidine kinase/ligand-binding sensor domain-containing protein
MLPETIHPPSALESRPPVPRKPGCIARFKSIWSCLFFLLPFCSVFASAPHQRISQMAHASWSAKDGITDVLAIAQTKDGYLWIATAEGLFRFDGINFSLWQPTTQTRGGEATVTVLCASRDGSVWLGSKSGVGRLSNAGIEHFAATNGLPEGEVTSILEDRAGAIFVGTAKGLWKFSNGQWIALGVQAGLPEGRTRVELEDRNGNLWVSVEDPEIAGGTLLGSLRQGQKRFELANEHLGTVAMLREAPDGQLWVAETSQSVRPFPTQPQTVLRSFAIQSKAILFDRDGMLWMGAAGQGLFRVDYGKSPGAHHEEQLSPEDHFDEKHGLSSDFISCVFEDREGNVWFGSSGGLDRFRNNRIVSWSVGEGLNYDQRLGIAACADGSVWTASEQGLQRIVGSKIETLGFDWIGPGWGNGVYSLFASSTGDLWVGALNGLGHIKGTEHTPVAIAGGMELHNVTAMTQDHEGGLWLCDQLRGVARLLHDKVRIFPSGPEMPSQVVNAAVMDQLGAVWLGFQDGTICRYLDGQCQAYPALGSVLSLLCDHRGRIWAAGSGGLCRFENDHFAVLKANGHFPNSQLSGLAEDDEGYFWIASRSGLIRIQPAELDKALADPAHVIAYDLYDASDGLRGLPRSSRPFPTVAKSPDGRIWFATTAGLAMVDPHYLRKNTNNFPPIHVVEASVGGKKFSPLARQELPAGTKDMRIEYTALSFSDPGRIHFKCKLEGYDEQWREMGTSRQIAYSGLGPRNYAFRVLACNADGVWDEVGATWQFFIKPAFYQRSWFLVFCFLGGVSMLWGLYRWNLARVTRQAEARMDARLEAQLDERKRIAQELHDTVLQGFTGVRLKLWAISQQVLSSPAAANEQLKQVIQQAEKCLAESRRSIWALRLPRLEETNLATAMKAAVAELVAGTNLRMEFKTSGTAPPLSEIVAFNLLRICEGAVSNVIRHAEATRVVVELHFEPRKVTLSISDDGRGFDPVRAAASGDRFGLAGMRERARIVGGNLTIQSQFGGPTTVTVVIG